MAKENLGEGSAGGRPGHKLEPAQDEGWVQEIALRAYYRYRDRGDTPGGDVQDWLAAEREVLAEHAETLANTMERPKASRQRVPRVGRGPAGGSRPARRPEK